MSVTTNQFLKEPSFVLWIRSLQKDTCGICAYVDAKSEGDAWKTVKENFPDYKPLYCCDMADVIIEDGTLFFPSYKTRLFTDCIGPSKKEEKINCFVRNVEKN